MLSDPRMTGPAITHVLPAAVVYDILFCPLVLWLVAAALGAAGRPAPCCGASAPGRRVRAAPSSGPAESRRGRRDPRAARAAAVPRLTFADTRQAPRRAPVPPPPKLRLAAHSTPSPHLTKRSTPGAAHLPRGAGWLQGSGGGWQKAESGAGESASPGGVRVGKP